MLQKKGNIFLDGYFLFQPLITVQFVTSNHNLVHFLAKMPQYFAICDQPGEGVYLSSACRVVEDMENQKEGLGFTEISFKYQIK